MFVCRWPNGDLSFVVAHTKEDAIVMLDEWDDAEVAEFRQVRDFMVDFQLNDEGEPELKEFGEQCHNAISRWAYPVLADARRAAPATASGEEIIRSAVEEERKRPLKPKRAPQPATEAAKELQKKMGSSATLGNRAVDQMATDFLAKATKTSRKQ